MKDNQRSYLIRFARECADSPWRIIVKSTADGETYYFTDLARLTDFFVRSIPDMTQHNDTFGEPFAS